MPTIIVDVMPKAELLDPQGKAVAGALARLGKTQFSGVRIGKRFEITVDEVTDEVLADVKELAETMLSNSVIEDVVNITVPEPSASEPSDPERSDPERSDPELVEGRGASTRSATGGTSTRSATGNTSTRSATGGASPAGARPSGADPTSGSSGAAPDSATGAN